LLNSATLPAGLPPPCADILIARDFDLITMEMGYQALSPQIFFAVMLNAIG